MDIDYRTIGIQVKKKRKLNKLSQAELAEAVDVGVGHISHIERGKTIPSLKVLIKIMNTLQLSPNETLIGNAEYTKPTLLKETEELMEDCTAEEIQHFNDYISFYKVSKVNKK